MTTPHPSRSHLNSRHLHYPTLPKSLDGLLFLIVAAMLSEAREPLLSNFQEGVAAAASVVGNAVLSVASGNSSLVTDKPSHVHHSRGSHKYPPHFHGAAEDEDEDDSFATRTVGRGASNLQEDALARVQGLPTILLSLSDNKSISLTVLNA